MSELKACPFCGGEAVETHNGAFHYVVCVKCYARSPRTLSQKEAKDKWNRRVGEGEKDG